MGWSIVPSRLRKVVLPPPEGPRMITNYPRFIAPSLPSPRRVMSCSATTISSPYSSYTFPRPSHSITPRPSISRNFSSLRKNRPRFTSLSHAYTADCRPCRRSQGVLPAATPCPVSTALVHASPVPRPPTLRIVVWNPAWPTPFSL